MRLRATDSYQDDVYRAYIVSDASGAFIRLIGRKNDLSIAGAGDGLSWDGGKPPFTIFCSEDFGPWGYIGMSQVYCFINNNILPDPTTPPSKEFLDGITSH